MYMCNGDVAQLGERLNGIQEAKSSILFISTRNFKGLWQRAITPYFFMLQVVVAVFEEKKIVIDFQDIELSPTELHLHSLMQ